MIFISPPLPPKDEDKSKKKSRSPLSTLRLSAGSKIESRNKIKRSLGTAEGASTLKIVLMYSVLGMILNWVLPTLIVGVKTEIPQEQADYWGTTAALVITSILLIVTLLKGIILRNTSQTTKSEPQDRNPTMDDRRNNK